YAAEQREAKRQAQQALKTEKQAYLQSRLTETDQLNAELEARNAALRNLLRTGLERQSRIDPALLYRNFDDSELPEPLSNPIAPPVSSYKPRPLSFFQKLIPGSRAKFERFAQQRHAEYQEAVQRHKALLQQRQEAVVKLNREVDAFNAE